MYKFLDNIKGPEDVKALSYNELYVLADEIRDFLVKSVEKTGGHLASNLGVVELTLSLLKCFDVPNDKIVWDVGHQTYVYKMLTGRKENFSTLRTYGGLSGFPKSEESKFDAFNTGHSSTSISAAFGLLMAEKLKNSNAHSVAVIGDGALTGGMAYEALNTAGLHKGNFIVILNDNEMSISKNVGSLTKHLTKLRSKPIYYKLKAKLERYITKVPYIGKPIVVILKRIKDAFRHILTKHTIFEDLGFTYLGPIDGHDIKTLSYILESSKKINSPVLIHTVTKKGKGYKEAENMPTKYHGVSAPSKREEKDDEYKNYSSAFGSELVKIAEKNDKVCAITAAMPDGTGLCEFAKRFPDRFFDVAIAEGHAVTFAAGLAKGGFKPVFAVYSTFLQRAYDQVFHDVCLQNLDVVFCIDRAGVVGEDGETHQGILDISYLSQMPNMTVLAPCNFEELKRMLSYSLNEHKGPVAIRYPKGNVQLEDIDNKPFIPSKTVTLKEGEKIAILFAGNMGKNAMEACALAEKEGINTALINLRTLAPLDKEHIAEIIEKYETVITIEDGIKKGGVGESISLIAKEKGLKTKVKIKAFPKSNIEHASVEKLYELYGLDAKKIAKEIMENTNE